MSILKGGPQTVNYLSFDGANDYVNMGTLGNWLSQNGNNFSIEITFSTEDNSVGYLLGSNNDLDRSAINVILNIPSTGENYFFVRDASPLREAPHHGGIDFNGNIQTVKYSYDNGTSIIEVDGVNQTLTYLVNENPNNFTDFEFPLLIGALNNRGTIQEFGEFRLYDFKIYNGSTLFLHYDMSEGSGNTLVDKAGNNNGTIVGATWQTETVQPAIQNIYYGQPTNYLSFDGVNDFVNVGTLSNWGSQNLDDFKIEIQFSSTLQNNNKFLLGFNQDNGRQRLFIEFGTDENLNVEDDNLSFFLRDEDGNDILMAFDTPQSNVYNGSIHTLTVEYQNNGTQRILFNGNDFTTYGTQQNPNQFIDLNEELVIGARNQRGTIQDFSEFKLYDFKIYNGSTLFLHYDMSEGSGNTLVDKVGSNDATIVGATWVSEPNEVSRVYLGESLLFGQPPLGTYELIADVIVTSNTTQIDFDNLNITKNDELRLVYTLIHDTGNAPRLQVFPNNFTNTTSYYTQNLLARDNVITPGRGNENIFSIFRDGNQVSGYADIKISNNDRFVAQSHTNWGIGSSALTDTRNWTFNVVGTFTISNISSLTLTSDISNAFTNGSRLTLYKVNTGVA